MPVEVRNFVLKLILDIAKVNNKKKSCNKKFCYDCLQKNFPSFWGSRNNKDWKCPCCSDECTCIQCKKNMIKENNLRNKIDIVGEGNTVGDYKYREQIRTDRCFMERNEDVVMEREAHYKKIMRNDSNMQNNFPLENPNSYKNAVMNENEFYTNEYFNSDNSFDFNKLFKSLQFSKVHLEKFSTFHRPKVIMN